MSRPVEDSLVKKQLQPKYFSVEIVGLPCLKMPMITTGDALDVND